jgi:hypothetical protein
MENACLGVVNGSTQSENKSYYGEACEAYKATGTTDTSRKKRESIGS